MTNYIKSLEQYLDWQPTYAAYDSWDNDEERKLQAIMEMTGEAGEVLSVATKARRKEESISRDKIIDELGDTFWGVIGIMNEFDITFAEMIEFNVEKLTERNRK